MGALMGHVGHGSLFLVLGMWHIFHDIKLHAQTPNYIALPWVPTSKSRYFELFFIMACTCTSMTTELLIYSPIDPDGTIRSTHLHNIEHASVSLTFLVYAFFAIILDKFAPNKFQYGLTLLLGATGFFQELVLFHFHSADHMGLEGQYHHLLQLSIFVSFATTLMGIAYPKSFCIGFVRSLSVFFQGAWFISIGFMLWIPNFIPKGCFMNWEEGNQIVRCHTDEALERAKSLANIEFCWYLIFVTIVSVCLYVFLNKIYGERVKYHTLSKYGGQEDGVDEDFEVQKKSKHDESKSLDQMEKLFVLMDVTE
ncbi:Transmembrane protein like [Actinidia chinensis var. chinensis]|uniref:Transmembrane protein like n=1 Tax=Actinidia chinensis var. chinensis TaxID=1590841 RepID=A0A2R6P8B1_ACTCC|nr:Transmembrane protein like [Actinidia chinensis var. chinensis]